MAVTTHSMITARIEIEANINKVTTGVVAASLVVEERCNG
jgi:hypothetical protein